MGSPVLHRGRHSMFACRSGAQIQADVMPDRQLIRHGAGLGRDPMLQPRRSLDLAQGILIGLRRCTTEATFDELVTVAHKHGVSVSAVASALVTLATRTADETDSDRDAPAVAHLAWGDLVDD
jgi:hypothetical protein